ncbi:MAG: hypothetical protein AAB795_00970 [Patescibacteria group bacterium]
MHKKSNEIFIKLTVSSLLIFPVISIAQTNIDSARNLWEEREEVRQENIQARNELNNNISEKLRAVQNEIRDTRESLKIEVKGLSKDEIKQRLEVFRDESRTKRDEMRKEIQIAREQFRNKAVERRDELKKKIGEERAKRVDAYFVHMMDRIDAAVDRLDKLADRIESRLNKIHDTGKDVTDLQVALDTVRSTIVTAHTAIGEAKIKFSELSKDDTPKDQFIVVKEIVNIIHTKTKEAHAALVDIINTIKKGRLDVEATSTPNTQ